jgi:hypothetical protein
VPRLPLLNPGDVVDYLGDFDLAGDQIEKNTRRVLELVIGGKLQWDRLALTEKQVEKYKVPRIIKGDGRYKDGRPHEAVETEAISQRISSTSRAAASTRCCPSRSTAFLNARSASAGASCDRSRRRA